MGKLRTDSTEDFPVESRGGGVGYLLVHPEPITKNRYIVTNPEGTSHHERGERREVEQNWEHFKSTKGEKEKLLSKLQESNPDEVTLLGYWAGRHRTDLHELRLPRFQERMENADL